MLKNPKTLICPHCGKSFETRCTFQIYCCTECQKTADNAKRSARRKELEKENPIKPKQKKKAKSGTDWAAIGRICKENGVTYGVAVARGLIK